MASTCLLLGFLSSIASLTSIIVALASSRWLEIRIGLFQNDVGLMRHCDIIDSYCGDMEHLNSIVDMHYAAWFRSVQALYLLHCIGMLVSTVIFLLYAIRFFESKGSFKFLTAFLFLTLAAGIYSVVIFGENYKKFFSITDPALPPEASALGYGFYMAIIGCCLSFIVMVLCALKASQAVDLIQNMQNRLTVWTTSYTLFVDQEA